MEGREGGGVLEDVKEPSEMNNAEKNPTEASARATGGSELTIDEVIERHFGSLGFSQILHVMLVSLAWIFDSQCTLVSIFSDAQPPVHRFRNATTVASGASNGKAALCGPHRGTWEWADGHKTTIVSEWGLICDRKFFAAIPASLYFIGALLGSGVYGHVADSWLGRKRTLLLACVLTFCTMFLISLSPNIWIYALLRFASGFSRSGIGICCLVLSTEVVGRKWRGQVGQCGFFFFSVGFLTLPLMAYLTRHSWRYLYRAISFLPLVYMILLLPLASESPRWLLLKGRNKEALDVLKKLAKRNGKQLPEDLVLVNPTTDQSDGRVNNEKLWKTTWAVKRMMMVMLAGFGTGFIYYGVQLNVENLSFNLYLTVALNALLEIPAVIIGSMLLGCANRRPIYSISAYLAGLSCVLCAVFAALRPKKIVKWPQLGVEAIGFMAASTAYDVLYVYCVELFPTNVRNFAVSLLRQALMLGASTAPLLVAVGRFNAWLSFLTFGFVSILSGLVSVWLRETKNAPLYETMKQQEEEEKRRNGSSSGPGEESNTNPAV